MDATKERFTVIRVGPANDHRYFTGRSKREDLCRPEFSRDFDRAKRYKDADLARSVADEWGIEVCDILTLEEKGD